MKLIVAEKPSVAGAIAAALGATSKAGGYYEGDGWIVSWCLGHLVSPLERSSSSAPRRDSTEPRPRGCSVLGEPPQALPSF